MSSLGDLPPELIHKIAKELRSPSDRASLRATSRSIKFAVEPAFFENIHIKIQEYESGDVVLDKKTTNLLDLFDSSSERAIDEAEDLNEFSGDRRASYIKELYIDSLYHSTLDTWTGSSHNSVPGTSTPQVELTASIPPSQQVRASKKISRYIPKNLKRLLGITNSRDLINSSNTKGHSQTTEESVNQNYLEVQQAGRSESEYLALIATMTNLTRVRWCFPESVTAIGFFEGPCPNIFEYQLDLIQILFSLPNLNSLMIYGGSIPAYSWGLRQQWHGPQMGLRILHITCGTLSYTRDQIARTINFLIGNCPNLSDLSLSFYSQYWGPREFDGDPKLAEILRLDQVRFPSTSITRLNSLSADGCNLALTPDTVLQLQNLTHIEFLDNECIRQEGFWSVLCSKDGIAPSVRLKSIKLSSMDPSFLDYLHSYSGLESLELKTQTPTSFRDWGDLRGQSLDPAGSVGGTGQVERRAIRFYLGIEKHAETIQVLSVESYKEDLWCFGGHNVGIIGKCHQLRVLGIPMDSKMVIEGDTTTEGGENVSYFIQQVFCHPSLETIRCYLAGPTEDVRVEAENKLVALGEMMMQQGARDDASFRWKYVLEDSASINSVTWQKS